MSKQEQEERLLESVKALVEQGFGRIVIARRLGISGGKATRLIRVVKGEDLTVDSGVLSQIKSLVSKGYGAPRIAQELDGVLTRAQISRIITGIRGEDPNLPSPLHGGSVTPTTLTSADSKERFDLVKSLVESGAGIKEVASELDLTYKSAEYWVNKVRLNLTRPSNIDKVRQMLDAESADGYDIAKTYSKTPGGMRTMFKKAECQFSPVDDWVKKAAKSGVLLSRLKDQLLVKTKEKAKEIIKDNFPSCFIVERDLEDGDVLFTPVHDSSKDIEALDVDTSKKPFKYYVSPGNNYLMIVVDDNYGSDRLVIPGLSDLHVGSKQHRDGVLDAVIEWISENSGMLPILNGDLVENISKASVGGLLEQYSTPNEQVVEVCKKLAPIAHKFLLFSDGNHEERTERFADFSVGKVIAQLLKVPHFSMRTIVDIKWRGLTKRLSVTHRYNNAYSIGQVEAQVMKLQQFQTFHVDAWYSGHNHKSFLIPEESLILEEGKGFKNVRWYILNNGSMTGRVGGYAERFAPNPQDLVYLEIFENGDIEAKSLPIMGI